MLFYEVDETRKNVRLERNIFTVPSTYKRYCNSVFRVILTRRYLENGSNEEDLINDVNIYLNEKKYRNILFSFEYKMKKKKQ